MAQAVTRETFDPTEVAWRGIELCREGDWQEGLYHLSLAAEADEIRTTRRYQRATRARSARAGRS